MIDLVIFDLDDTLVPEIQYVESGYNEVAKIVSEKYSKPRNEIFEKLNFYFKNNVKNVFNKLLDDYKIAYNSEDINFLVNAYRNHNPNINYYADVLPTIEKLKEMKIHIGIISDGYLNTQKNKIKVLNANSIFDEIILTEELR